MNQRILSVSRKLSHRFSLGMRLPITAERIWLEMRIVCRALFDWRTGLKSKLVLLLGISYLFVPIDLIPDRLPIVGHLDELSFLVFGFVGARRFVPADLVESYGSARTAKQPSFSPGAWQELQFFVRVLRADLANFSLLHYRGVDGFLVTSKNSGTHWLKFMLSCAIAEQFGVVPPPRSTGRAADQIISHPKWQVRQQDVPWIGSSHTIPSIVFTSPWMSRILLRPPVVVLVRDIRAAMRSNYLKWCEQYDTSLTDYVRGDPTGRQYIADLWWYMHFFNRWSGAARANPEKVLIVRYEDLQANPPSRLRQIAAHLRIQLDERAIDAALRYVSRQAIRSLVDPDEIEIVVPTSDERSLVKFSPADEEFMRNAMRRHLRTDLGYGYRTRFRR